jgi:excisionase family DNA binding protein
MSAAEVHDRVLHADPAEQAELAEVVSLLDRLDSTGETSARLVGQDGEAILLPPTAYEALRTVIGGMAQGLTITLVPHGKEMTTQEAADLLNISRTYVVKLIDQGELTAHKVGTHRRLRIEDVLAYRDRRAEHRREALRRLTEMSEEGGYE